MLSLLKAVCPTVVATRSSHPRSMPAETIASLAGGPATESPHAALEAARALAGRDGAVVVCGSLYLINDLNVSD